MLNRRESLQQSGIGAAASGSDVVSEGVEFVEN